MAISPTISNKYTAWEQFCELVDDKLNLKVLLKQQKKRKLRKVRQRTPTVEQKRRPNTEVAEYTLWKVKVQKRKLPIRTRNG